MDRVASTRPAVSFFRGASAYARRFNPARVEFTGAEVLLAESADFLSTSDAGTVLYGAQRTGYPASPGSTAAAVLRLTSVRLESMHSRWCCRRQENGRP